MTDSADYAFWLFDLDGTLVDVERRYARESLVRVGDELGCGLATDERTIAALWHGPDDLRERALAEHGISLERFWETFDRLDDPMARAEATFLYDDASVVADLDAPTALVTHCPWPITERVLATLDIDDWFDAVICCDEETGFKPDPTPVRRAIGALDVAGDGGVLVGDSACDVGAAWNVGIDGVHIERRDSHESDRCVLADRRITTFRAFDAHPGDAPETGVKPVRVDGGATDRT